MARLAALTLAAVLVATAVHADQCSDKNPWPYRGANYLTVGQTIPSGGKLVSKTAVLSLSTGGNLALIRNRDNKTVWQTNTDGICAGATATFSGDTLSLANKNGPCWSVSLGQQSEIIVLSDHCALEAYEVAPLTNMTWASNGPMCVEAHIVPHSHDDVGWLLSPERYYDGCETPGGGVRGILTTIMNALQNNSNRTFNQVESYFFNRWWLEQDNATKALVQDLVNKGQLVFLNGGWSMHDEACVHQESAISNMEVGAKFLKDALGVEMNIGWHIDPFGHASTTPRIMAEMGFDAFFFWRTDYEQKAYMLQTKQMETMWHNSPSLGNKTLMFTSIMYNSYCYGCNNGVCPAQFYSMDCMEYDKATGLSPAMQFLAAHSAQKQSKLAELQRRVGFKGQNFDIPPAIKAIAEAYVQTILDYEPAFRTGHVLMPWGCDFAHVDAEMDYHLMDQIIEFINDNYDTYGVHMFYSTAPQYVQNVRDMEYQWPVNYHDYFLDSDDGHAYWSGYLSSRAEFKGFERMLMNERSAADLVLSAVPLSANLSAQLQAAEVMREAMGIAQHHDSITGTERQAVRNQYQAILTRGWTNISVMVGDVFATVANGTKPMPCMLANLSYCPATDVLAQGTSVSVFLFNPIAQARTEVVTVPVPVFGVDAFLMPARTKLVSQVVPTWELTTTVDNTSPQPPSHSKAQAYVQVPMNPLSLVEVLLVPNAPSDLERDPAVRVVQLQSGTPVKIANDDYAVTFDPNTFRLTSVTNLRTNLTSAADQSIGHYCPHDNIGMSPQPAGAYIMRTCDPHSPLVPYALNFSAPVLVTGPLCQELRTVIDVASNIHQAFRVCQGQPFVEITSGIGEVSTLFTGVEVIMNIKSDVESASTWYVDSQALEMQQRVRDSRPNYPYTVTEPIAANFFPCNAFSFLNGSSAKNLAVAADRSRATASINDGELQFLVQRRLLYDDNRGVGAPLDENTRVLTTSRVVFNSADLYGDMRLQSLLMTHKPIVRFGAPSKATAPFAHFSYPAGNLLPPNVHLHTRTVHAPGEMLVRLQHLFAAGEGPYGVPTTVDLSAVIPAGMKVLAVTDMDMNGVRVAAEMKRLDFPMCVAGEVQHVPPRPIGGPSPLVNGTASNVTLQPMEMRVFQVVFEWQQ